MNNIYISVESLAAIVILILIYANIFEVKQKTNKRKIFTRLLIANEIVVVVDAISWLHLGWSNYPWLLWIVVAFTYLGTSVMQIFFLLYLYEHISMKSEISKRPFQFMINFFVVECVLVFILGASGMLFYIEDGQYKPGAWGNIYYIINLISILILAGMVVSYRKKLSMHDMCAALSYCLVPFISLAVTLLSGLNISVTLLSVSMLIMYVMLQSESESFLYGRANLDEMTKLFNRAAYEDEILQVEKSSQDSLVYASIDLNGLKVVNDSLGHVAGDELICGAADCLKKIFGKCGKVFRIGGDEFVSIFFADEDKLEKLKTELEKLTKQWKGKEVETLTLSVGYVTKKEFPDESIVEIAKIADSRMYEEKTAYYAKKGIDRRGQNDAHKVLCSLYTKILKINITDNSYSIIDMNIDEQKKEMGFADSISEWLENFGKTGQIHPDDLDDYLSKTNLDFMREYFNQGKTSLSIIYRRKYGSVFKQVMMEIIPTKEYSSDNQWLYLYVKKIDI